MQQVRNANNLYPVEIAMGSSQQTVRWESIRPQILVGNDAYPMRATLLMTNRWEGLVPVPAGSKAVTYRYKVDYECNGFGKPKTSSQLTREYTLRIVSQ
jgi:hypothetical protein